MAEYIDLNNTEVLTEAGENAKLVVEEDGELKRIPASAVGQVKTVNGVEPDEAGNVDVSYNNLLDKPFGVEPHRVVLDISKELDNRGYEFVESDIPDAIEFDKTYNVTVTGPTVTKTEHVVTAVIEDRIYLTLHVYYQDFTELRIIYNPTSNKFSFVNQGDKAVFNIRIEKPETIEPIDYKFLPEGMRLLGVTADTTNGTDYTFSHTGIEILNHISMGGNVSMSTNDGMLGFCYGLYMATSSDGSGNTPYIAFGSLAYENSKPCIKLFLVPMHSTAGMYQMFALETYTPTPT